ncbi:toprim domain-containing protein [Halomonas venusta]|uniref:DUF7146 domain-containing protein n=1 Tax=Vreelandella venusta TaxID=44935 RepID=UPI00295E3EF5|nr:toprim domain-containing protein [Halomonas venusta]MDW0360850.1 toprim domain-containing protein [Halomonas venusta]
MKIKTAELARHKWRSILAELGINRSHLINRHGPCPLCGGSDRFRFDDKDGKGTYFCSGCGAGDGMKLAMQWTGLSFKDCAKRIDDICDYTEAEAVNTTDHDRAEKTRRRLKEIGEALRPAGDLDPVGRYLRGRGIRQIPKAFLRYHPALAYYDQGFQGNHPAMVAAFRRPDGSIETFHVTYLTADGHKANVGAPKKVVGAQQGLSGCAIRLTDIAEHIAIAEGIETALSVTEMYGIPCWSCYSAHGIETFEPPEGVKTVTIYSDSDANFTGQAAAMACAKRLAFAGYTVHVPEFPKVGADYNDMLLESAQ